MTTFPRIVDDLEIGIVVHDPETAAIIYANEYASELYGYSVDELRRMDVAEFSVPSYTQSEAEQYVFDAAAGDSQQFEWRIRRSTDELLWIEVRLKKTVFDGTSYVLAQVRDITSYKVRERRLRLLNRLTRHNLRNKVNVIHGYTDDLLAITDDESHRSKLGAIKSAAGELVDLTETITALKSITDQDTSLREPVNIADLVTDVVDEYREEYPGVEWTVVVESDVWVAADEGLRMAFSEVVENTVEHNSHDELTVGVTITESEDSGFALIRTTDNGRTIPEMELDALTDEYQLNQMSHGEGAGFWVMESVVESLGGRVTVETTSDGGNTVQFKLPQTAPPTR